ncbi:MAG: hypothetical protein U0800_22985 [Isosphaeraceae bacterium]
MALLGDDGPIPSPIPPASVGVAYIEPAGPPFRALFMGRWTHAEYLARITDPANIAATDPAKLPPTGDSLRIWMASWLKYEDRPRRGDGPARPWGWSTAPPAGSSSTAPKDDPPARALAQAATPNEARRLERPEAATVEGGRKRLEQDRREKRLAEKAARSADARAIFLAYGSATYRGGTGRRSR